MKKHMDLSSNTRRKNRQLLIENRVCFAGPESELSIYDTYKKVRNIGLASDQIMYCGMLTGKKIIHDKNHTKSKVFLPHQSYVIKPKGYIEIDFPEAKEKKPTTCLTIEISKERVNNICDKMGNFQHLDNINPNQEYCNKNIHFHHTEAIQQLLNKLVGLFTRNNPDKKVLLDIGISELVVSLLRQQSRDLLINYSYKNPEANGINAAIDYLKNNIDKPFDIDKLTQIACMSRSLFYSKFKNQLYCTPCEFYWKLRLQLATDMLKNGKSVTYACYSVGFKDIAHFTRRFKQLFGYSPSQYQRKFIENNKSKRPGLVDL